MAQLDPTGAHRSYWLREPVGDWSGPRPTLVFLHGVAMPAISSVTDDGLVALADHEGAVLVAPEGWRLSWAAGGCCGQASGDPTPPGTDGPRVTGPTPQTDDVAFIDQVWSSVGSLAPVDLHRRAVLGFSNGGMLAARWACAQGTPSPAVSVAGPLLVPCAHAVDLLHIHGRWDSGVPLAGGWSTFTHTHFPSSLTEASRLPAGSRYRLVVADMVHRWAPVGHRHGEDVRIWRWLSRQWSGG